MDDVAHDLGPPDKRDQVGRSEYWTYYHDHGTEHRIVAGHGSSTNHYDKITLEFVRGVLVAWQADVR